MNANVAMDQERCAEIFERVRRAAAASDVEVTVQGGRSSLTRFANNSITQNVSEEGCEVSVRVQMGGRTARATTNRLDEESLQRVVRQAEELARVQEEDPELLPMLTRGGAGQRVGGGPLVRRDGGDVCGRARRTGGGDGCDCGARGAELGGDVFERRELRGAVQLAWGGAMASGDAGAGFGDDAGGGQLGLAEAELHQRAAAGCAGAGRDRGRRRRCARRIRWNWSRASTR